MQGVGGGKSIGDDSLARKGPAEQQCLERSNRSPSALFVRQLGSVRLNLGAMPSRYSGSV